MHQTQTDPSSPRNGTEQRTQAPPSQEELERTAFLSLLRLPAILRDKEAGWLLNFSTEDVGRLVAAGHLRPLGHVSGDDTKRSATVELEALRANETWMDRACDIIYAKRRKLTAEKIALGNRA